MSGNQKFAASDHTIRRIPRAIEDSGEGGCIWIGADECCSGVSMVVLDGNGWEFARARPGRGEIVGVLIVYEESGLEFVEFECVVELLDEALSDGFGGEVSDMWTENSAAISGDGEGGFLVAAEGDDGVVLCWCLGRVEC